MPSMEFSRKKKKSLNGVVSFSPELEETVETVETVPLHTLHMDEELKAAADEANVPSFGLVPVRPVRRSRRQDLCRKFHCMVTLTFTLAAFVTGMAVGQMRVSAEHNATVSSTLYCGYQGGAI